MFGSEIVTRVLLLVSLLALAACAKSEEASLVPPQEDDGYNMVEPVKTPVVQEGELALGEWARSMQEEQPALTFGPPSTEPLFSLRCDTGDGLLLQRHGVIAQPGLNQMLVEAGGEVRRLAVNPVEGPLPLLRGALPPQAELAGELASAQDRISVRIGTAEPLVMPPSPLIGEFIRSCSQGDGETPAAPATTTEAQANEAQANEAEARPSARTPR
jgi:hypothetical protein